MGSRGPESKVPTGKEMDLSPDEFAGKCSRGSGKSAKRVGDILVTVTSFRSLLQGLRIRGCLDPYLFAALDSSKVVVES